MGIVRGKKKKKKKMNLYIEGENKWKLFHEKAKKKKKKIMNIF